MTNVAKLSFILGFFAFVAVIGFLASTYIVINRNLETVDIKEITIKKILKGRQSSIITSKGDTIKVAPVKEVNLLLPTLNEDTVSYLFHLNSKNEVFKIVKQ